MPPTRARSPSGGNSDAARSAIARSIGVRNHGIVRSSPESRSRSGDGSRTLNHGSGRCGVLAHRLEVGGVVHAEAARDAAVSAGRQRPSAAGTGCCGESERRRDGFRSRRARRRRSASAGTGAASALPLSVARPAGQHEPDAAAGPSQRDRAFAEQLVAVGVSVGLRRINAGVAREPHDAAGIVARRAGCRRGSCPTAGCRERRRIRRSPGACRRRRRTLRDTRAPNGRIGVRRRSLPRRADTSPASCGGERSAPGEDRVRQRAERLRRALESPGRTTTRTRDPRSVATSSARIRGRSSPRTPVPSREPAPRCRWASTRARSAPARPRARRRARSTHRTAAALDRPMPGSAPAPAGARAKGREPCAEQAVAHLQPMIEEAERPIAGERGQPQRQPGELHGHRIQVDAVQTAFGHGSADRRPFGARRCRWAWQPPVRTSAASYAAAR